MESTLQETSNLTDQRKTTKRKCKKKINYAESDIESDIEAATKVNYRQKNLTNDDSHVSEEEEPIQNSFNRNTLESKELLQL